MPVASSVAASCGEGARIVNSLNPASGGVPLLPMGHPFHTCTRTPPTLPESSPATTVEGGNFMGQRGQTEQHQGSGTGATEGRQGGPLDPLARKTFVHFVAKPGDGFAPTATERARISASAAAARPASTRRREVSSTDDGNDRGCFVGEGTSREDLAEGCVEERSGEAIGDAGAAGGAAVGDEALGAGGVLDGTAAPAEGRPGTSRASSNRDT